MSDRGQGDVDGGRVELGHEQAEAAERQHDVRAALDHRRMGLGVDGEHHAAELGCGADPVSGVVSRYLTS